VDREVSLEERGSETKISTPSLVLGAVLAFFSVIRLPIALYA
jgi:hypothetical protein